MTSALRLFARGDPPARAVSRAARPGCGAAEAASILDELRARQRGMNPALASVVDAPGVTDILINGGQAWVDRGGGLVLVDVGIPDEADARRAAIRMASACGVRLDDASPIADGTLPGGVRLHAVLAPVSGSGTLISLRVLGTRRLGIGDLEACGTLTPPVGPLVRALVAARANVLISGSTGSGKTTLLSAALSLVPAGERIICIEEVPEIAPAHPHCVHLVERAPNVEGRGALSPCPTSCAPPCACGPTGSSSGNAEAPKCATSSPPSTPDTMAAGRPCTPTARATCPRGSRRSAHSRA